MTKLTLARGVAGVRRRLTGWGVRIALTALVGRDLAGNSSVHGLGGRVTGGVPFSSQTSQQDCEPAPETSSVSLLDEDPEPLSQQLQVTRARSTESLDSLTLSPGIPVALEYLPFFRTSGQLQDNGLLTPQPAIYKDKGEAPALTLAPAQAPEDAAQPSGFFPYYHSQEECFPSLALPDWPHRASQDPVPNREAQMGCFCKMTARDICTVSGRGSGGE